MKSLTKSTYNPYAIAVMAILAMLFFSGHVSAQNIVDNWDTASQAGKGGAVGQFFLKVSQVLMYICAVVSVIIVVLAFKGLAGQGDWRTFWNKIAGGVGIFAVPTIINYLLGIG